MGFLRVRDRKAKEIKKRSQRKQSSRQGLEESSRKFGLETGESLLCGSTPCIYTEAKDSARTVWSNAWNQNITREDSNEESENSQPLDLSCRAVPIAKRKIEKVQDIEYFLNFVLVHANPKIEPISKSKLVQTTTTRPVSEVNQEDKGTNYSNGMSATVGVFDSTPGIMEKNCGTNELDQTAGVISPSRESSHSEFYCGDTHSPSSIHSSVSSTRHNSEFSDGEDCSGTQARPPSFLKNENVTPVGFRMSTGSESDSKGRQSKRARVEEIVTSMTQLTESRGSPTQEEAKRDSENRLRNGSKSVEDYPTLTEGRGQEQNLSRKRKLHYLKQKIDLLSWEYQHLQDRGSSDAPPENGEDEKERTNESFESGDESKQLADIVEVASSPGQFLDHALDYIKRGKGCEEQRKSWSVDAIEPSRQGEEYEKFERSSKRMKLQQNQLYKEGYMHNPRAGSTPQTGNPLSHKRTRQYHQSPAVFLGEEMRRELPYNLRQPGLSTEEILFVEAFKREVASAAESAAETSALRVLNALGASGIFLGRNFSEGHSEQVVDDNSSSKRDRSYSRPLHQNRPTGAIRRTESEPDEQEDEKEATDEMREDQQRRSPMSDHTGDNRSRQLCSNPRRESLQHHMENNNARIRRRNHSAEQMQPISLVTNKKQKSEEKATSISAYSREKVSGILPDSITSTQPQTMPVVPYPFPGSKSRLPGCAPPLSPFFLPTSSTLPHNSSHSFPGFLPGLNTNQFLLSNGQGQQQKGSKFLENPFRFQPDFSSQCNTTQDITHTLRRSMEDQNIRSKAQREIKSPILDNTNNAEPPSISTPMKLKSSPLLLRQPSYSPVLTSSPTAGTVATDRGCMPGSAFRPREIPSSPNFSLQAPKGYPKSESYEKGRRGRISGRNGSPEIGMKTVPPHTALNPMYPFPAFPFLPGLHQNSHFANAIVSYQRIKEGLRDHVTSSPVSKMPSCRVPGSHSIRGRESGKYIGALNGGMSFGEGFDAEGEPSHYSFPTTIQEGLTPQHLKKAKLIFFYTRYPNANTLKSYFPDVKFTRAITSQLIKWFSNFREFFYIQMEKFARQAVTDGVIDASVIHVTRDSELFRVLNLHYNKCNEFHVPERFLHASEASLREFFLAVKQGKDSDPAWKKVIYKVICKLDAEIPELFKSPSVLDRLHEIVD